MMMRSLFAEVACGLAVVAAGVAMPLAAQDLPGAWSEPPSGGGSVLHEATGLAFPPKLAGYELAGIFDFANEEGMFVRYVSAAQRSRADVFLFPLPEKPDALEAKQRVILREIDAVILRLEEMEAEGTYKEIEVGDLRVGKIELWQEEALPLASREVKMVRIGESDDGAKEAGLVQWVGATVMGDHVVTLRHLRPQDTGEMGRESMESFVTSVVQLLKDPSLKKDVVDRLNKYAADPLGPEAVEHTLVVLAYLNQSLAIPTLVPAPPLTLWLAASEASAPGANDTLQHAFVMGHAKYILENPDASLDDRLEAACAQMAAVYELLKQKQPGAQQKELDELQRAVGEKRASEFIKART